MCGMGIALVMDMTNSSEKYNKACAHLVAHGGHANAAIGRKICADALIALRRERGREYALRCKRHLEYISGHLPVKLV